MRPRWCSGARGLLRFTAHDRGFTLVELLIVVAVIAILAVIAIPGLMRSRQTANEASAIGSIRAINSSEASYAASCGWGGYAQSLSDLALAPPSGVPFLTQDIATGAKSGYQFSLTAQASATTVVAASSTCNGSGAPAISAYHATAVPLTVGLTGQRSFGSNASGTIYEEMTGAAIANPIPAGTDVLQ